VYFSTVQFVVREVYRCSGETLSLSMLYRLSTRSLCKQVRFRWSSHHIIMFSHCHSSGYLMCVYSHRVSQCSAAFHNWLCCQFQYDDNAFCDS